LKKLAILGASGHGKVVAEIAELNDWDEVIFFDDAWPRVSSIEHWKVSGNTDEMIKRIDDFEGAIVAIGNNLIRFNKTDHLLKSGFKLVKLIHPNAVVSKYAEIGKGTVIMAGTIINPFSKVGESSIINTSATVDHDCLIGEAVHICPGTNLSGGVIIGDRSWIGVGSVVRQCIKIGKDVVIGAGAVVVKDVKDGNTVVGIPAKPI